MTQTTLARDADAGDTGTSSSHRTPLRRHSQQSASLQKMGSKRRRLEAVTTPASSPPQRRISTVLAQPPEVILASPQSDEPQSPQLSVRKRASTAMTQTTLARDADAGDTGTSSSHRTPLRRHSQQSASLQKMGSKRRRLEAVTTPASSPPQRRISTVLAQPPEVILASPQSDEPQSPQLSVRKRASTAMTQTTLARDADAGDTGTSSLHRTPLRRHSQRSASLQKMGSKRRRLEAVTTPASSPPQRRISTVLAQPPEVILASPQSDEPQSPQLSDPDIMPQDTQQETDLQQTFTLHLQAVVPNQPTTPADITPPPQTTPTQQLSPTPPQPEMGQDFWSSWATQQAQHYACLQKHSQYLASLPHHLPRLSRN
ncbi:polycystin-1-like protein 3 [Pseudophryne corroboree]|uniref:polycystin-1-like protein 3 n=1 Tax=Pseudophryne corroboree TaxID=495146 RepID=UPI003081EA76